jgi:hypothetical protein
MPLTIPVNGSIFYSQQRIKSHYGHFIIILKTCQFGDNKKLSECGLKESINEKPPIWPINQFGGLDDIRLAGVEPATDGLEIRSSIQLS